jgi:hypothetical protein
MAIVANRMTERFGVSSELSVHRQTFRNAAAKLLGFCRSTLPAALQELLADKLREMLDVIGRPATVRKAVPYKVYALTNPPSTQ